MTVGLSPIFSFFHVADAKCRLLFRVWAMSPADFSVAWMWWSPQNPRLGQDFIVYTIASWGKFSRIEIVCIEFLHRCQFVWIKFWVFIKNSSYSAIKNPKSRSLGGFQNRLPYLLDVLCSSGLWWFLMVLAFFTHTASKYKRVSHCTIVSDQE